MKDFIEYKYGDISIKKTSNGWLLIEGSENDENELMLSSYESEMGPYVGRNHTIGDVQSLVRLLQDAFEGYFRTKYNGGMTIEIHEKGSADICDEENKI